MSKQVIVLPTAKTDAIALLNLAKASGSICRFCREYFKQVEGLEGKELQAAMSKVLVRHGSDATIEARVASWARDKINAGFVMDGGKDTKSSSTIRFKRPSGKVVAEIVSERNKVLSADIAKVQRENAELKAALAAKPVDANRVSGEELNEILRTTGN